jgi:hypothetical protein
MYSTRTVNNQTDLLRAEIRSVIRQACDLHLHRQAEFDAGTPTANDSAHCRRETIKSTPR